MYWKRLNLSDYIAGDNPYPSRPNCFGINITIVGDMLQKLIGSDNYINYVCYLSDLYQSVFLNLKETGTNLIKYFVSEGDTVFDIGANIGRFATLAAGLVGKNGKVYCFEPLSYPRRIMRHMVFIRRLHQVAIIDSAISNKNGKSIMTIPLKDGWKPKFS